MGRPVDLRYPRARVRLRLLVALRGSGLRVAGLLGVRVRGLFGSARRLGVRSGCVVQARSVTQPHPPTTSFRYHPPDYAS